MQGKFGTDETPVSGMEPSKALVGTQFALYYLRYVP